MQNPIQITRTSSALRDIYQADCQNCGACCAFFARREGMIVATGPATENASLSYWREMKHVNVWPDGDREEVDQSSFVMRTKTLGEFPACVALEGEIGKACGCAIYEQRPSNCAAFDPGTVLCLAARAWAGIPPLLPQTSAA